MRAGGECTVGGSRPFRNMRTDRRRAPVIRRGAGTEGRARGRRMSGADDERMNPLLGQRQAPSRPVALAERGFNRKRQQIVRGTNRRGTTGCHSERGAARNQAHAHFRGADRGIYPARARGPRPAESARRVRDERMNPPLGQRQAPSRLVALAERGFNRKRHVDAPQVVIPREAPRWTRPMRNSVAPTEESARPVREARIPPSHPPTGVRAGGLCEFPAANSFAPGRPGPEIGSPPPALPQPRIRPSPTPPGSPPGPDPC